nr:E-beta-farnesene synthase [Tanacetum cinerariifolium]
ATQVNNNNPFSSPVTPDALINFVNNLGYPKVVRTLSAVTKSFGVTDSLGYRQSDYAERMWEELTQSIHSFVKDKKNLALHTQGQKKANPLVIPSISAKGTKREVFGMPIPNEFITADIQCEQYYKEYLEKVAKHQRYLADEEGSDPDSPAPKSAKATKKSKPSTPKVAPVTKPAAAQQPKPKPAPAKSLSLVDEFVDEEADMQMVVEESLKSVHDAHQGPLPPMVIREPYSGKFQPLLEVQEKGKEKRRTPAPTEPSSHAKSPSIYTELGLTDSDTGSDEEGSLMAGSNPGDDAEPQPQSSHVIHAGTNLEHMDLEATDVSTQQHTEKIDKWFTATAYPNVQENLKLTVEE